jgi:hypothetical protein
MVVTDRRRGASVKRRHEGGRKKIWVKGFWVGGTP